MHNSNSSDIFERDAPLWWQPKGPFSLLHAMNPLRLHFITETLGTLHGLRILDVGCGGGILCEPLARLGAHVTGIDTSASAIFHASAHATDMGLTINYRYGTLDILKDEVFDCVIASEVIEHTEQPNVFVHNIISLLSSHNKGIIISTINRSIASYLGAICAAEYILRWVPRGTHEWKHFIKPSEIAHWARPYSFEWKRLDGLSLNPITKKWSTSTRLNMNYIGHMATVQTPSG
jgi:2-polyprenyl-6-hydroxyphenyl methylase/3-demethylubiquinone-9 3-methyltransferase